MILGLYLITLFLEVNFFQYYLIDREIRFLYLCLFKKSISVENVIHISKTDSSRFTSGSRLSNTKLVRVDYVERNKKNWFVVLTPDVPNLFIKQVRLMKEDKNIIGYKAPQKSSMYIIQIIYLGLTILLASFLSGIPQLKNPVYAVVYSVLCIIFYKIIKHFYTKRLYKEYISNFDNYVIKNYHS